MVLNKKAMFFTLLVITLLSLFVITYSISYYINDRIAINKRVDSLNNFVFSVEKDIPRQIYISGFRVIFLFETKIIEDGNYISDLESSFEEVFYNGTLYGQEEELMIGATFQDIEDTIQLKADKVNVNVDFSNPSISVIQEDPWNVKFNLTIDFFIGDKAGSVQWNKTESYVSYIPVTNFEDPLYIVNTNGLVSNKINKTIYENFIYGGDVSNLSSHLENSYYIESNLAPSFLKRLQGNLSADENGIESLVYLPELSAQGIILKDKSCVDYIYFSSNNPLSQTIAGMPSWFKLDEEHLSVYGI